MLRKISSNKFLKHLETDCVEKKNPKDEVLEKAEPDVTGRLQYGREIVEDESHACKEACDETIRFC